MGFGKSLKKAFKKVAKIASNPLGGGDDGGKRQVEQAPEVAAPQVIQATTEVAKKEGDEGDDADTEAAKKKARSGGKKTLSVARGSGTGVNL